MKTSKLVTNWIWAVTGVVLGGCLFAFADDAAERDYIALRQSTLDQFENHAVTDKENSAAVKNLGRLIQAAVGPIRIQGFSEKWHSNIRSFQNDVEQGRADGVEAENSNLIVFVSTQKILSAFLGRKSFNMISVPEVFFSEVFDSDAAITIYFDLPVKNPSGVSESRAFVGLEAQDIGPFAPDKLIVIARRGDQIFVMSEQLKDIQTQIPECEDVWARDKKIADAAYAKYTASNLQNRESFEQYNQLEEAAYKSYHECFRKKAKLQGYFLAITKRAAAILGRLE